MTILGRYNRLRVLRLCEHGLYLDGGAFGELLLPTRYVPAGSEPGGELEVFVYRDSEDRPIATTERPYVQAGEFACLRVVDVVPDIGAFLDWGLSKDLLVPFREQHGRMRIGGEYVVRVYVDDQTDRIAASARVNRFIHKGSPDLRRGQEVELLVTSSTEPGYNAIIDHRYRGLIHHADAFRRLRRGERLPGYVKRVRGDGRVDLLLRPPGYEAKIDGLTAQVLAYLRAADGPVTITAKSAPSVIYDTFGMSKKNYKKAIGALYKQRLITIEDDAIRLAAAGLDGRET